MEIYINGTGAISPQPSFEENNFTSEALSATNAARLKCLEPDYKNYINPSSLRRMSRMIKMGIASSKICLENANVSMPGAIITGTGLGCVEDTEKFSLSILENHELLLTPTPFIQSTHNTVGGQIALLLGCHAYNFTYVHRGISFESSLLDASMLIQEKAADDILVGGIDELTDNSYTLLQQLGIYSRKKSLSSDLSDGTPAGEGAAFFLVSGKKTEQTQAKISVIKTFAGKHSSGSLGEKIKEVLSEKGKRLKDISLVLTGNSGNAKTDLVYQDLKRTIFKETDTTSFKQYCGEYHTASAFGCWWAVKKIQRGEASSVLLCNQFGGADYSILLIEKC
ncbi:MAG TPA: beta-ketoacyl synthase N-terminal-like domain-containing protein [Cytophagaceae bacterium]|nr:beta-ketoacyl synthase N-terminal-like domain-containing protein [Cytophagaceae bacterium]